MASLKAVLQFWKSFDLDSHRLQWDQQGLVIQENKESSSRARKKLAEQTKAFRRLNKEQRLESTKDLLRAYQEEIDALSRRAKGSENAFFSLYKGLYEAPDPVGALAAAVELGAAAAGAGAPNGDEVGKLRAELKEYEMEFAKLTNQDIKVRKLEDKLAEYERELQGRVDKALQERQVELGAVAVAKMEELNERERDMGRRLDRALAAERAAKTRAQQAHAQLVDAGKYAQEREAAWAAERDILVEIGERARAQEVRLLEEVRKQGMGAGAPNLQLSGSTRRDVVLEEELAEVNQMLSSLRDDMREREKGWDLVRKGLEEAAAAASAQSAQQAAAVESLKAELNQRPTVAEVAQLRQQLSVLQELEYNVASGDGEMTPPEALTSDPENTAAHTEHVMREIIRTKVRRLEAELSSVRRECEEARSGCDAQAAARKAAEMQATERAGIIQRLEDDLACKRRHQGQDSEGHVAENGAIQDLLGGGSSGGAIGADSRLLAIVQAQRDRFRKRIHELEVAQLGLQKELQAMAVAKEQLNRDNVKLYERIRFLQSYQTSGSAATRRQSCDIVEDGSEEAYRVQYETRLDPFARFSQKEQQRKIAELPVIERITLNTSRICLGNRIARNFVFSYFVLLHLVVFATLYSWAHHSHAHAEAQMPSQGQAFADIAK